MAEECIIDDFIDERPIFLAQTFPMLSCESSGDC